MLDNRSGQENSQQFFYSDLSVINKNGYIPAAGVGVANQ
jgi:hypothetical protein